MMKRLAILSTLLVPLGNAASQEVTASTDRDAAVALDAFIQEAIADGRIRPAGAPEALPETGEATSGSPGTAPVAPGSGGCPANDPLDFSLFADVSRYEDILPFQQGERDENGRLDDEARQRLMRAYLSVGFTVEALSVLPQHESMDVRIQRAVARLLQEGSVDDMPAFEMSALCHASGDLWLAVARLQQGHTSAIDDLSESVSQYRKLPVRLRAMVAGIVVPILIDARETTLAERMLAAFTEEEIRDTKQVRFLRASVEIAERGVADENETKRFLSEYDDQPQARNVVLKSGAPLSEPLAEVMLDDEVSKLSTSPEESPPGPGEDAGFRLILDRTADDPNYETLTELLAEFTTPDDVRRAELLKRLKTRLAEDIASDDPVRILRAISVMASGAPGVPEPGDMPQLADSAARKAYALGLGTLGDALGGNMSLDPSVIEVRAESLWRENDYAGLFELAESGDATSRVSLLASLAAIDVSDVARLRRFEPRVDLEPENILALVEADAARQLWIVSPAIYDAAENIEEPELRARLDAVNRLRAQFVARPKPASMAKLPESLRQSRERIEALKGGMR